MDNSNFGSNFSSTLLNPNRQSNSGLSGFGREEDNFSMENEEFPALPGSMSQLNKSSLIDNQGNNREPGLINGIGRSNGSHSSNNSSMLGQGLNMNMYNQNATGSSAIGGYGSSALADNSTRMSNPAVGPGTIGGPSNSAGVVGGNNIDISASNTDSANNNDAMRGGLGGLAVAGTQLNTLNEISKSATDETSTNTQQLLNAEHKYGLAGLQDVIRMTDKVCASRHRMVA